MTAVALPTSTTAGPRGRTDRAWTLGGAALVVVGCVLLEARPALVAASPAPAATLVALFVALLLVGAWWPIPTASCESTPATGRAGAAAVVALGVGAFAVGRLVGGGHAAVPATMVLVLTNTLAAVAEEAFFRRLCFGLLAPAGVAWAVAGSALLFAVVHVTTYGWWVLPARPGRRARLRLAAGHHRIVAGPRDHPRPRQPPGGALTWSPTRPTRPRRNWAWKQSETVYADARFRGSGGWRSSRPSGCSRWRRRAAGVGEQRGPATRRPWPSGPCTRWPARRGSRAPRRTAGSQLAAEWANDHHVLGSRRIELVSEPADRAEAVPGVMADLHRRGIDVVVGSHASAISQAAAATATQLHQLFWETGAVGQTLPGTGGGTSFFRVAPMGSNLGSSAIDFIAHQVAPHLEADHPLRYAVAYVDDPYGREVADGAIAEIHALHEHDVGSFRYDATTVDYHQLARRIAAARPDVLYVSAYIPDGIALRRALVDEHVPLLANIGTSSSYCMLQFGQPLGADAVGLFASDKPDADDVQPGRARPRRAGRAGVGGRGLPPAVPRGHAGSRAVGVLGRVRAVRARAAGRARRLAGSGRQGGPGGAPGQGDAGQRQRDVLRAARSRSTPATTAPPPA